MRHGIDCVYVSKSVLMNRETAPPIKPERAIIGPIFRANHIRRLRKSRLPGKNRLDQLIYPQMFVANTIAYFATHLLVTVKVVPEKYLLREIGKQSSTMLAWIW